MIQVYVYKYTCSVTFLMRVESAEQRGQGYGSDPGGGPGLPWALGAL